MTLCQIYFLSFFSVLFWIKCDLSMFLWDSILQSLHREALWWYMANDWCFLGAVLPAPSVPASPDAWISPVLSFIISPLTSPIRTPRSVDVLGHRDNVSHQFASKRTFCLSAVTTVQTYLNTVFYSTAAAQSAFLALPVPDRTPTAPAWTRTHSSGTSEPKAAVLRLLSTANKYIKQQKLFILHYYYYI